MVFGLGFLILLASAGACGASPALGCGVSSDPLLDPLPLPPASQLAAFGALIAVGLFVFPLHPRDAAVVALLLAGVAELLPRSPLGPQLDQRREGLAGVAVVLLRVSALGHVVHGVLRLLLA